MIFKATDKTAMGLKVAFHFFLISFLLLLASCRIGKNTFGGSKAYISAQSGKDLVLSLDSVLAFNSESANLNASQKITSIQNQKVAFSTILAPFDLTPDDPLLGTVNNGWITLTPTASNSRFSSGYTQGMNSNSVSFIFLIKKSSRGDILSLNPFDPLNQAFELEVQSNEITAKFKSSIGDEYQNKTNAPDVEDFIVGATFDSKGDGIRLSVQGGLSQTVSSQGSPTAPFQVDRMISLGSSTSGQQSFFKEGYIFNRALSVNELGSVILLIAKNNNIEISLDPAFYKQQSDANEDEKFKAAQAIIESKCSSCHSSWSNAKAQFYFNNGLAVQGNAEASSIYFRISGSSGSNGPKNMPLSGLLTATEISAISEWILNAK